MGFLDNLRSKAQQFTKGREEQVNQGLEKAGRLAKERFGHDEQVDKATGKTKEFLGQDSGGQDSGGQDSGGQDSGGQDSGGQDSGGQQQGQQEGGQQGETPQPPQQP